MKAKLTAAGVAKLAQPKAGRLEVFDTLLPGFGVRVTDKGRRTFFAMYRVHGKLVRHTIGNSAVMTLEDARAAARDAMKAAHGGSDPRAKKAPARATDFDKVAEEFMTTYRGVKVRQISDRTKALYDGYLKREFIREWKGRPIASIEMHDVAEVLDAIKARGTVTAALRAFATAKRFFGWAVAHRFIKTNPARDLPRPGAENPRDRVLDDGEIGAIWTACDALGYPFGPLFQIMLVLGRREGSVARMKWADVDLDTALWTLPAGDDKSRAAHVVPLPRLAVRILKGVPRMADAEFVFTTTGKTPVSGFSRAKAKLDQTSKVAGWVLHDTRRTCRTNLSRLGVLPEIAKLTIGHKVQGIDRVYDRWAYLSERRAAIESWAKHLEQITKTKRVRGNVVQIKG